MPFKMIDLTGKKFGKLTVISLSTTRGNRRQLKWNCLCDCGKTHLVTGESLRHNKSRSCGCLLRDSRYVKNKNTDRVRMLFKLLYFSLKKRHAKKSKSKNIIPFDNFITLSLSNCFYCNSPAESKLEDVRYSTKFGKSIITDTVIKYNGLDRVDNTKGYEADNVVACCKYCNMAKNEFTQEHFRERICKIYNNWAKPQHSSRPD